MSLQHNNKGMEVVIEGGTKNEQYLVGAIVSKALTDKGFVQARHVVDQDHAIDPSAQGLLYPSLLGVIRESRPDFLNTPVIVSAYERPPVAKERRSRDRVMDQALSVATSYTETEKELNRAWNDLSVEEKQALFETPVLETEYADD